jgi:hypothetical protein
VGRAKEGVMTSGVREERVQELGESAYLMLKQSYSMLQELKGMVDRLHASCLQQSRTMDFDTVSAIKLTTDRLYGELERYLRPEVDPDSAYSDAMIENPIK